MNTLQIFGGHPLEGTVAVHGAKNSVLPILAASVLVRGETVLHNCPDLTDVDAAMAILRHLGCTAVREKNTVVIDAANADRFDIPDALMREMRSSVIFLGAVLARTGAAELSLPGGCELGPRPIDMHLKAMRAMNAVIDEEGGDIRCRAGAFGDCVVDLPFPSVGATENSMLAATRTSGTVIIRGAAREPEISDLACFLREIGVQVAGEGTDVVTVGGGNLSAKRTEHRVIPDRIVAATLLSAVAAAGGDVTLEDAVPEHVLTVSDALCRMGCEITSGKGWIRIRCQGRRKDAGTVETAPYPGFPTDAQPPLMAACLRSTGTTVFKENIFTNRYRHAIELCRMGADIQLDGRIARVRGVEALHGAAVTAPDLRGGAALMVAALAAEGMTEISGVQHIDRGYEQPEKILSGLGAEIRRT